MKLALRRTGPKADEPTGGYCCPPTTVPDRAGSSGSATARVALVGNPNVGKSTLFNQLTGARQRTMNAPRTTVSVAMGQWTAVGSRLELVDLPGTYSLVAVSPDETVTANTIAGLGDGELAQPDLALVLLDATALSSSLYLLAQVRALGLPVVGVLTMADVATTRGIVIDQERLAGLVEAPLVLTNPRLGRGVNELAAAVVAALAGQVSTGRLTLLDGPELDCCCGPDPTDLTRSMSTSGANLECLADQAENLFDWVAGVMAAVQDAPVPPLTWSDKVDRLLLRWWTGVPLFLAVLWGVFQLTTVVAGPIQDWFEALITRYLAGAVSGALGGIGVGGGWLESVLVDGVLAGVGVVVSFLPLMAIMFAALALLEDSGYMARVAVLADRLMRAVGLDGRAVLPLVLGFGCNVPALVAVKTLPHARQRLLTGLLVPLTSCTARLVVYLFMAQAFFPNQAGTVVWGMYLTSVVLVVAIGWLLRRTAFRGLKREPLVMVLPAYQIPRIWPLVRSILLRCRGFAVDAGKVIVTLSLAVWLLMAVPVSGGHSFGAEVPPRDSALGAVSAGLAQVFEPAGFGEWHASAALITGFVAKEALVGTLATTYGLDEPDDGDQAPDLAARVRGSLDQASGGHSGLAAVAFMVFCLTYTPCMVAVAEQKRQFGARITVAATTGSVILAWILAVLIFQVGRLFG